MPDHTCCGCPCLPASAMSLVSSHFFFYFIFVFTFPICPCLCPCACICICIPVPTSMSLCPCLSVLTPANLHLIMPGHTCCGCPHLPASAMSLVSSHYFFYFILVFMFPICPHPCVEMNICVASPRLDSLMLRDLVELAQTLTKGALNAPRQLQTIYRHREHMIAHGLTGLVHSYKSRTI